ncbi:MAG TPA: TetR/AcrR family transcriptional regulator [Roseiflexaceae bacterium]|nr:TetR/AcrR family transcriptional regulator [Roseiflexaceae bacterium]
MTKGEQTRQRIVARAAPVFNVHGFAGTSMGQLTEAIGLEKGGIYNHFPSKEALALHAFDYAVGLTAARFAKALEGKQGAVDRLLTIIGVLEQYVDDPTVPGGCPILNTAIEADDAYPPLRERAKAAMTDWHKLIGSNVKAGVRSGELRLEADPRVVASVLTATMEGALMLSKLYDDPVYMRRAVDHVSSYIRSLASDPAASN